MFPSKCFLFCFLTDWISITSVFDSERKKDGMEFKVLSAFTLSKCRCHWNVNSCRLHRLYHHITGCPCWPNPSRHFPQNCLKNSWPQTLPEQVCSSSNDRPSSFLIDVGPYHTPGARRGSSVFASFSPTQLSFSCPVSGCLNSKWICALLGVLVWKCGVFRHIVDALLF